MYLRGGGGGLDRDNAMKKYDFLWFFFFFCFCAIFYLRPFSGDTFVSSWSVTTKLHERIACIKRRIRVV